MLKYLPKPITHGNLVAIFGEPVVGEKPCACKLHALGTELVPAWGPARLVHVHSLICPRCDLVFLAVIDPREDRSLSWYPRTGCTLQRPRRPR